MDKAVAELRQIPFSQLIGGPLTAAIEAQALAAQSTIEFIQKIGFKAPATGAESMLFTNTSGEADAGEIRNVTFTYTKKDEANVDKTFSLTVPLLTIAPIPYIRIDEITIDFKAKLTDSIVRNTASSFDSNLTVGGNYGSFWTPYKVEMRASATYKSSSSSQAQSNREYSLDIHVRAVQDQMPAGLSKILDILENAIKETKS